MNTNAPQAIECPVCDWLEGLEGEDWSAACEEIAAFAKQERKEVPGQSCSSVQAVTVLGSKVAASVAGLTKPGNSSHASAWKARALSALRSNSSLSVRLARYNDAMARARALEAQEVNHA